MSDAEQTMNEAMYDTDEDLMNAPIGTFDTSETSDNIVLGNKYDSYNKKEQAKTQGSCRIHPYGGNRIPSQSYSETGD